MKIDKYQYVTYGKIGEGHVTSILDFSEIIHLHSYLDLFGGYQNDWWVAEAEEIVKAYVHDYVWERAFIAAWEQSER